MRKKSFDQDLYKKTGINNLILFCVYSVVGRGKKCTFELLVKECFDLFPEIFRFSSFLKWPDSRKLDRSLRTLRKRKLIKGGPQSDYFLTGSGERIAKSIGKGFGQRKLKL